MIFIIIVHVVSDEKLQINKIKINICIYFQIYKLFKYALKLYV